MPHPTEGSAERPDPLRDEHVAFPDAPSRPIGPPLPPSAWAPTSRTSPIGGPPPSPPHPGSPSPASPTAGHGDGALPRRRRVLRTMVVVWISFAVFGNHGGDSHGSGDSGHGSGYGMEVGSGSNGRDATALLPVSTDVVSVPNGVRRFHVEVASNGDKVTVTRSTGLGKVQEVVAGSWAGDVVADAGYPAPAAPAAQQSSKGPVGPTASGIVTANAADNGRTVQCRVYADDLLVLMSTGPGTVTCRVPAVDGASG